MKNSLYVALTIGCCVVSTIVYADMDCVGQQNGEQQIGGCWDCEESIKNVMNTAYLWKIELGSGTLSVNNTDQSKAAYECAAMDNVFVNISVTFTTSTNIPTINTDKLQCRTRTGQT